MTDGSLPEDTHLTLGTLFAQALARNSNRVALADDEVQFTYNQLRDRVGRLLTVFDDLGLQRGDGIGLGTDGMTIDFAALYVACQIAGIWTTELPPYLPVDVTVDRMLVTGARLLVVDHRSDDNRVHHLSEVLTDRLVSVADLSERAAKAQPSTTSPRPAGRHCGVMFTSGSTGKPKPVLIPARGAGVHATMIMATLRYPTSPVTVIPVTHQLILQFLLVPTLLLGGTVVTVAQYSPSKIIDAAGKHNANAIFLTTSDIYALAQRTDTRGLADTLELVFYGGEPMSATKLGMVTEAFGQIFVGAYGQTETLTAAFLHPDDHDPARPELLSAAGRAMIGVRVEIRSESGHSQAVGEPGEILISSPGCMLGYLDMDDATRQTMEDGWVRTGDIGLVDDNGYIHVMDRAKFVFKRGETTIYPHLVEEALTRHPDVLRATVVGVADAERGHRVCAVVTVRSGSTVDSSDLRAVHLTGLPHIDEIQVLDALPVTPAGKVDRGRVQSLFSPGASSVDSPASH